MSSDSARFDSKERTLWIILGGSAAAAAAAAAMYGIWHLSYPSSTKGSNVATRTWVITRLQDGPTENF